jgi:hypothetical protein
MANGEIARPGGKLELNQISSVRWRNTAGAQAKQLPANGPYGT